MRESYASLTYKNGELIFEFSYDAGMVAALKASIPHTDRQWDGMEKAWRILPVHAQTCAELTDKFLGITVDVPKIISDKPETRQIKLMYLGKAKDKGQVERVAAGHDGVGWNLVFPEAVLREWFNLPASPLESSTHYGVLGLKQSASPDEIKQAYRRLARQWHPDVCKQPGATEQFKRIGEAYEILRDAQYRAMYDSGLALQATMPRDESIQNDWMPPLRCGWLLAQGMAGLGKFRITKILAWEDIINEHGEAMVVSWGYDALRQKYDDIYTVNWL